MAPSAGRGATAARVDERRDCFAVVAPGLEAVAAAELRALGIEPGEAETGGIAFRANDARLFQANLWLRTVSRVTVRVASFRATTFRDLERLARAVAWGTFLAPGGTARLRVTCRKSKLYHSDGVAQRVGEAIARTVKGSTIVGGSRTADDDDSEPPAAAQLFIVRFDHDLCTISVDSSGELLHRRGYRLATAKAPLRETLAAGALLSLGYDGSAPLVDPMCGAGTIAIEAALIARRMAPGLGRAFACEAWPAADTPEHDRQRSAAREAMLAKAPHAIVASDRDAGAIAATRANAARGGVDGDIDLREAALSAIEPPPGPGLLLTNPPYGERIGDKGAVRNLYAQLGNVARAKLGGWTLAYLSADQALDVQLKLPLEPVLKFRNGGIPIRLVRAEVPPLTTRTRSPG